MKQNVRQAGSDQPDNRHHYIDNEKFCEEMTKWKIKVLEAEDQELERPAVTEYIGECFLLLSTRLALRPNFIGYSFRDDLVSDGVENCLRYAKNFKPEKSKNPFSFFTQIIFFTFLRRIAKEKKVLDLKHKLILDSDILEKCVTMDDRDNSLYIQKYVNYLKEFVQDEEKQKTAAPSPVKKIKGSKRVGDIIK